MFRDQGVKFVQALRAEHFIQHYCVVQQLHPSTDNSQSFRLREEVVQPGPLSFSQAVFIYEVVSVVQQDQMSRVVEQITGVQASLRHQTS